VFRINPGPGHGKIWGKIETGKSKMPAVISKIDRENLFQEICNTLRQWPDLERRVFSQAHYHGQSVEAIALSLQLNVEEASAILKECDCRLNACIRRFRINSCEKPLIIPVETACTVVRGADLKGARAPASDVNKILDIAQVCA
jgi:hypothetical protein